MRAGLSPAHDVTLARALAKAPGDRFASAQEMSTVVRVWPTEPLPAAPARDATARSSSRAETADAESVDVELGRSAGGRLIRRRDARVGRWILVEERDVAVDDDTLAQLRTVAAAGGPHLQRVLAISDDRRAVIYEAIAEADEPAEVMRVDALPVSERAALADAIAGLHAPGAGAIALAPGARAARTAGGWVVLVAPVRIDE